MDEEDGQISFHPAFLQVSSPGRPHETIASSIVGSEQMPPCHKKARNVCLQRNKHEAITSL